MVWMATKRFLKIDLPTYHLLEGRLGYENETLRLLPLPPHAGAQPIGPTYMPKGYRKVC